MRTQGGSPNLINGVSTQPPEVRLTSQLDESLNQFPTVSRGLVPRNPAMLRGVINTPQPQDAKTHMIDRDDVEQYVVTVSDAGIEVHTLDGTPKVVVAETDYQYIAGAVDEDLEALTVQDYTFIVNKSRTVTKDVTFTDAAKKACLVHIVQGDYFATYQIRINGSLVASVATEGGPYADSPSARLAEAAAKPTTIARLLATGSSDIASLPATTATHLGNLSAVTWTVILYDNVIYIENKLGDDFSVSVDAGSESRMRVHKEATPDFTDLPSKAPAGFVIRVSGGEDTNYDDYYVQFDQSGGTGEGSWKETVAPDVQYRLDASTMPHVLIRQADGTFLFKAADWAEREVGDDDTNPWPSFVGQKIKGLSFGNNRYGMFSGESLAQSRNGSFFNFWVESIISPLDTDPVDAAISYPEVSTINHVVPFSGETILFTRSVPFRMVGGSDTLTQSNIHYDHLVANSVSPRVRPVAAGSYLYFVNDTPSGCFVHEFSYDRAVDNLTPQSITDHVSGYVPTGVTMMEADGDLKLLALVSETSPNTVYVYKWLWIGNEKAQSAWQKWTVQNPIVAIRFYGEELVIVTKTNTKREVLSINCHEAFMGTTGKPVAYLDRQTAVTGVYSSENETTTFTLPYTAAGATLYSTDAATYGNLPTILSTSGTTITVEGEWTGAMVAGFEYESYGVLSPLYHRTTNNQGSYGNALPGFETTVSRLTFGTGDSAFLKVTVDRDYRKPYVYELSADLIGTKTNRLGALVVGAIDKPLSIMSKSEDFTLTFGNDGPYPYSILSYAWVGDTRPLAT